MSSPVRTVPPRALAGLWLLAAVLVVAGCLPWVASGPLAVRLISLPLLAAGLLVGVVGYRLAHAPLPAPAGRNTSPDPGGCAGCGCGAGGCRSGAAN